MVRFKGYLKGYKIPVLTGLFAVFTSQKWKDWTCGLVFCSLGQVWLWSFSSHETGLPNTKCDGNRPLCHSFKTWKATPSVTSRSCNNVVLFETKIVHCLVYGFFYLFPIWVSLNEFIYILHPIFNWLNWICGRKEDELWMNWPLNNMPLCVK